jgi:primase-polymerase (primpol)-like protein
MKFEKLSDKKFDIFEKSQVINPILISGGWVDTTQTAAQKHDRYVTTNGNVNSTDNYQESKNGNNYTADGYSEH